MQHHIASASCFVLCVLERTTQKVLHTHMSDRTETTAPQPEEKPSSYLGAIKAPAKDVPVLCLHVHAHDPHQPMLTDECALSSVTSHDRMETLSNLTHGEIESVVSSWIEDDDCFMAAAMHEITIRQTQPSGSSAAPTERPPQGKGWKVAQSGNQRNPRNRNQNSARQRGSGTHHPNPNTSSVTTPTTTNSSTAPLMPPSGGRFDALSSDNRRRW